MDLPAEVRNEIWTLLAVGDEPIEAQIRPIRPKPHKRGKIVVRRFPQEPSLSAVNKQLRKEVLSLFYGMNKFIFDKSISTALKEHNMTEIPMMKLWRPRAAFVNFLTHLEVRLNWRGVTYLIYRKDNAALTVDVKVSRLSQTIALCLCPEQAIPTGGDLVDVAMELVSKTTDSGSIPAAWMRGPCQKCGQNVVKSSTG